MFKSKLSQRFSIRKGVLGVASVFLGFALIANTAIPVLANVADAAVVQTLPEKTVSNHTELITALKNAQDGETIVLPLDYSGTITEADWGSSNLEIAKNITIKGEGTLTLRGLSLTTNANVTLKDITLNLLGEGVKGQNLNVLGGKLVLDNVNTKVSVQQDETRPIVSVESGELFVTGDNGETKFEALILDQNTKAVIANRKLTTKQSVLLSEGSVLETSSDFLDRFAGQGNLVFVGTQTIDGVHAENVANIVLKDNATVGFAEIAGKPNLDIQAGSKVKTQKELEFGRITGTGTFETGRDGGIRAVAMAETVNYLITSPDKNFTDKHQYVYLVTDEPNNANPQFQHQPTGMYLKKELNTHILLKGNTIDKEFLMDIVEHEMEYDLTEGKSNHSKYATASPELKAQYDNAIKQAIDTYENDLATEDEVTAAEDVLYEALEAIINYVAPTETPKPQPHAPVETTEVVTSKKTGTLIVRFVDEKGNSIIPDVPLLKDEVVATVETTIVKKDDVIVSETPVETKTGVRYDTRALRQDKITVGNKTYHLKEDALYPMEDGELKEGVSRVTYTYELEETATGSGATEQPKPEAPTPNVNNGENPQDTTTEEPKGEKPADKTEEPSTNNAANATTKVPNDFPTVDPLAEAPLSDLWDWAISDDFPTVNLPFANVDDLLGHDPMDDASTAGSTGAANLIGQSDDLIDGVTTTKEQKGKKEQKQEASVVDKAVQAVKAIVKPTTLPDTGDKQPVNTVLAGVALGLFLLIVQMVRFFSKKSEK